MNQKSVDDLTGEFLEVESNRRDPRDTVYQPSMSEGDENFHAV